MRLRVIRPKKGHWKEKERNEEPEGGNQLKETDR
jgi:hypothetical protein